MAKYRFGLTSEKRLTGVKPELVRTARDVLALGIMDFSVIYGVRTHEEQEQLYRAGRSMTMNSKHLKQPDGFSHALDLVPYPLDWKKVNAGDWVEISRFGVLNGLMQVCAKKNGIIVAWGNDWDRDGQTMDHNLHDAPHFEFRGYL